MHMVAAADRTDLAGGEETGHTGGGGKPLAYDVDVVVGAREQRGAASVAGEHQRAFHGVERRRLPEAFERLAQIGVCGRRVTELEADSAADRHEVTDDKTVPMLVETGDTSDQEVALLVLLGVLIDRDADLQAARGERLVGRIEVGEDLLELAPGRHAG